MKRSTLFWIIAVVVTISSAVYQRITGPTYPLSGTVNFEGQTIRYHLLRSHGGTTDAPVSLSIPDTTIETILFWKRVNVEEPYSSVAMARASEVRQATLPSQPMAGKLQYYIQISKGTNVALIPGTEKVIIRFKGDVPLYIIIPHVLAMFLAMLLSTRAGLEGFLPAPQYRRFAAWTLGILFVGGFILGPLMQWYAFRLWWTGWPFGTDMTDNKTFFAFIGWAAATLAAYRTPRAKYWMVAAAVIMLVVYLIPHSVFGTELDYATMAPKQ